MKTAAAAALVVVLAAAALAPRAAAHEEGKAEPRIAAAVGEARGLERTITVRLTDTDSGEAVSGAEVSASAEMTTPHVMRTAPWTLTETEPGTYQARVRFPMEATWSVGLEVSGEEVVSATASLQVTVARNSATGAAAADSSGVTVLPTRLAEQVTPRDIATMAVLWLHGIAAVGWILGVVAMALALSSGPDVLAEGVRGRIAAAYRSWGAWLHWGLVPVIVITGVYNMLYVTPFPIAWRPSDLDELAEVPYGELYEAILVVKLGLFAALLITGTRLLLRTVRAPERPPLSAGGAGRRLTSALGPAGLLYLACVPLILGAAVALRYVHILSHVADVVSRS